MDGCLVSSPLPLDSNMMYSDGGYNTSAGPFSPILSSIHNSYSSSTFLTVNIQHRHTSLLLRPSMVCMVAGSCREAPTDDLFPQTNMKVEIMSTTRPVTCSGLIIMQLCTNDGVAVAGEPFMVIGWDIDQVMEERHFFARVCDNPYDTGDGADTGGGRADGDISMLETDGVGSGKRDQKMLEENWMARTSLLQKMMRGRAHEAGRRVTTRCIIAGNKLPGDNQLAVTAFMSSVGAPRLDVEFGQDG
ncbi:hypothetical protein BDF19DRAFT_24701 [Syncephalis fuscata]|nr:hypothetical protein BDF19DRAFT_24701 [Syncephalis fuscata]